MRKIKEVLRLRFELGLSQDQIARSCSLSQAGRNCLARAMVCRESRLRYTIGVMRARVARGYGLPGIAAEIH